MTLWRTACAFARYGRGMVTGRKLRSETPEQDKSLLGWLPCCDGRPSGDQIASETRRNGEARRWRQTLDRGIP